MRVQNQSKKPFQVFTPFWRHCLAKLDPAQPFPAPRILPAPAKWPKSLALDELELRAEINWAEGLRAALQRGEAVAAVSSAPAFQAFFTKHAFKPTAMPSILQSIS